MTTSWQAHRKPVMILQGWPKPTLQGNIMTSMPHLLQRQEKFWGNKCFIWLSRCHHRPGSRKWNLSIWWIPHHDNWELSTNVTHGTYYGTNRSGTLEQTQRQRKVKQTFNPMEQIVQKSNPRVDLPLRDAVLTLEQVTIHLIEAAMHLRQCQKNCDSRGTTTFLQCMIQIPTYWHKLSKQKAAAVCNIIYSEQCRILYSNLRNMVKATASKGLQKLMIPQHRELSEYPTDFQHALATTDPEDIIWDTVLDKESIKCNLIWYNRYSFRAAAASPCRKGTIHKGLSFNNLSKESAALLAGKKPPQWYEHDDILREFLTLFAIPDIVKTHPAMPTDVKQDHVSYGFMKWKENTSISSSRRHLGHYKAIIKDSLLLKCLTQALQVRVQSGLTLRSWCKADNNLIEKDTGRPKITWLHIIHLFEADMGLLFGRTSRISKPPQWWTTWLHTTEKSNWPINADAIDDRPLLDTYAQHRPIRP